ncbi:hypothetical protein SNEBB_001966 [Seison nebaliae]|nr:hypothetical protein SNEBB_001966 [Seison nebaliae]
MNHNSKIHFRYRNIVLEGEFDRWVKPLHIYRIEFRIPVRTTLNQIESKQDIYVQWTLGNVLLNATSLHLFSLYSKTQLSTLWSNQNF